MNIELKLMLAITRRLPKIRGAGWFANKLKAIYNRKSRPNEVVTVHGIEMELETNECVDGGIFFYPQLYDWRELDFVRKNLIEGGRFVDAGAISKKRIYETTSIRSSAGAAFSIW